MSYTEKLKENNITATAVHSIAIYLGLNVSKKSVFNYIEQDFKAPSIIHPGEAREQVKLIADEMISHNKTMLYIIENKLKEFNKKLNTKEV